MKEYKHCMYHLLFRFHMGKVDKLLISRTERQVLEHKSSVLLCLNPDKGKVRLTRPCGDKEDQKISHKILSLRPKLLHFSSEP